MLAPLHRVVRGKAARWLWRAGGPEPGEAYLGQRRVYILPTGAGAGFGVLLLILLTGSINYNLGLGFALTFLAGTCAVADIYLTWKNLARLHLRAGRAQPVFAGEDAHFELHLINRTGLARYALWVDAAAQDAPRHALDVPAHGSSAVTLRVPSTRRGVLAAPRVCLQTRFPLGLFRAWSYWQPAAQVLVYPFPEENAPPLPMTGSAGEDGSGHAGDDDFAGVRSYQAGDAMRHLAWRQIARFDPEHGGALLTKHFEGGAPLRLVLDFDALPAALALELRLSRMARWVLEAERRGLPYGFRMGAVRLAEATGDAHRAACLRALALHGLREDA